MDPVALAVGAVTAFFGRALSRTADVAADRVAHRVLGTIEPVRRTDPAVGGAVRHLRQFPRNRLAANDLHAGLARAAAASPAFAAELRRSVVVETTEAVATGTGNIVITGTTGARSRINWSTRNITRNSGAWWGLVGAGSVVVLLFVLCAVGGYVLVDGNTTFFDTKTSIKTAKGWHYSVSEARLRRSPQLDDGSPAQPGYQYVYFDITVENELSDREAPGIEFSFARSTASLGTDCGAEPTVFFGPVSSYAAGVVPDWCVSKNGSFLTGGAKCYETNDAVLRGIDRLPAGGRNQVRCVDSYLVRDDFDLASMRVYYLGTSYVAAGSTPPSLQRIPVKT